MSGWELFFLISNIVLGFFVLIAGIVVFGHVMNWAAESAGETDAKSRRTTAIRLLLVCIAIMIFNWLLRLMLPK